jgi:hypothetical protein
LICIYAGTGTSLTRAPAILVPMTERTNRFIEILSEPVTDFTWIKVAFLLENKLNEFDLSVVESYFQSLYQAAGGETSPNRAQATIQTLLNSKINTIQSKKSNLVNCLINFLKTKNKQRVNCFGAALVSYLIALVNRIPCQFYSSETHCWIELSPDNHQQEEDLRNGEDEARNIRREEDGDSNSNRLTHEVNAEDDLLIVDVMDNLKARKKSKLPLSIYFNKQPIDSFGLCLMLICNENPLSEEEILTILHHFKHKLKYSWEISKYFSLAHDLCSASPSSCSSSSSSSSSSSPPSAARGIKRGLEEESSFSITATEEVQRSQIVPLSDLPSVAILDTLPKSFEFLFQRVSYYLNQLEIEKMFLSLTSLTQQTTELCLCYSVNSELWFDEDCSFLSLAEDICEKLQEWQGVSRDQGQDGGKDRERQEEREMEREMIQRRYEEWIDEIATLCDRYLSESNGEKLRRQIPMISGKRRRIEKKKT